MRSLHQRPASVRSQRRSHAPAATSADQEQTRPSAQEAADVQQPVGQERQFAFLAELVNRSANFGTKNTINTITMIGAHDREEGRVGHCAHRAFLQIVLGLGEFGHAGEGLFEETAFAAGADHAHGHFAQHRLEARTSRRPACCRLPRAGWTSSKITFKPACEVCSRMTSKARSNGTPLRSKSANWL